MSEHDPMTAANIAALAREIAIASAMEENEEATDEEREAMKDRCTRHLERMERLLYPKQDDELAQRNATHRGGERGSGEGPIRRRSGGGASQRGTWSSRRTTRRCIRRSTEGDHANVEDRRRGAHRRRGDDPLWARWGAERARFRSNGASPLPAANARLRCSNMREDRRRLSTKQAWKSDLGR